jgi:hypothetical protein
VGENMMKFLLLFLVFCSIAGADPKIGQNVVYEGSLNGHPFIREKTITNFYPASITWRVHYADTYKGKTDEFDVIEILKKSSNYIHDLKYCAQLGANIENISVGAGLFETCHFIYQDGDSVWFADVPFGIIKAKVKNSSGNFDIELKSFVQ